jgi:hypothetical protein
MADTGEAVNSSDPWVIRPLREHLAIIAESVRAPLEENWEAIAPRENPPQTSAGDSGGDDGGVDDGGDHEVSLTSGDGEEDTTTTSQAATTPLLGTVTVDEPTISFLTIPTRASALNTHSKDHPDSGSAIYYIKTRERVPCTYYLWLRVCVMTKNRVHGLILQPGDPSMCAPIKWRLDTVGVPEGWHWQLCPFGFQLGGGITRFQIAFCTLGLRVLSLWVSRSEGQFPPNYRNALNDDDEDALEAVAAASMARWRGDPRALLMKSAKSKKWQRPEFRVSRDPDLRRMQRAHRAYVKNGMRARRRNAKLTEGNRAGGDGVLWDRSAYGVRSVFVVQGNVYDDEAGAEGGGGGGGGKDGFSTRNTTLGPDVFPAGEPRTDVGRREKRRSVDRKDKVMYFPDAADRFAERCAQEDDSDDDGEEVNVARELLTVDAQYNRRRRAGLIRALARAIDESEQLLQATRDAKEERMVESRAQLDLFNNNSMDAPFIAIMNSLADAGKQS